MKKIFCYVCTMIFTIVVLPLVIVKGCDFSKSAIISNGERQSIMVDVYMTDSDSIRRMEIDEYIKGVIAAEMPAEFEIEALKAQAVASRTYTFARIKKMFLPKDRRHENADVCTDHTHCQGWISKTDAIRSWGDKGGEYWKKIEKAVNDTQNIIITYKNNIINPVFHSNSGGRTENAHEVWKGDPVPYLKSVESFEEEISDNFIDMVTIEKSEFIRILKEKYPGIIIDGNNILEDIRVKSYSEGGRVKNVIIGNIEIKGTDFRSIFSLKSSNFNIEKNDNDSIKITTMGYGHGVGMSQWGANYMAKEGSTYEQILKHYYSDVELKVINIQ